MNDFVSFYGKLLFNHTKYHASAATGSLLGVALTRRCCQRGIFISFDFWPWALIQPETLKGATSQDITRGPGYRRVEVQLPETFFFAVSVTADEQGSSYVLEEEEMSQSSKEKRNKLDNSEKRKNQCTRAERC